MRDENSITAVIAAQDAVVRDMIRYQVEHGVLIPLKTAQELREDYATEKIYITRAPVKCANPAIR